MCAAIPSAEAFSGFGRAGQHDALSFQLRTSSGLCTLGYAIWAAMEDAVEVMQDATRREKNRH